MEAKLKSLKVVDLKQILTKANVSLGGKANKADLVAKIISTPAAVNAYNDLYPSAEPATAAHDDLLAPPEDLDWTVDEVPSSKVDELSPEPATKASAPSTAEPAKTSASDPAPAPSSEPVKNGSTTQSTDATSATVDVELEKRRQRAARFGIPLVEPKSKAKPKQSSTTASKKTEKTESQSNEDALLQARAKRFGINKQANGKASSGKDNQTSPGTKRKRAAAAPVADVDPEEAERRRKRAERFGLKV
ncbi:hypothetical protein F5878DRAFT_725244 [Lentinula raphanica]|uniref:SAP domain-containing protein n=1 Tax=Lentinula raphanica TaxID=153919 RepID=A0AA38P9C3_9AGAR|nr:hypothetical protein F5880DRAFT_1623501 [Lentinula raphanica]KAJ3838525.1 hypothetical protein F5878DRAFT_725244 [Lentinula raphanica]